MGAKTAAVTMTEEDLIFASSKGYIKENILKLISSKSRNEIKGALEELGKEIGKDMGIVIFSNEKKESVKEKKIRKNSIL